MGSRGEFAGGKRPRTRRPDFAPSLRLREATSGRLSSFSKVLSEAESILWTGSQGGFVPKRTVGLAAKRLYRTAQGFSPGLRERGIRPGSGGRGESLGYWRVIAAGVPNVGCHLQGTFHRPPDPGLKPWAVLYSRFAAKSNSPRWVKTSGHLGPEIDLTSQVFEDDDD